MSGLRGAVIGTGYFSHFHLDAWSRISEVDIVACCDVDAEKARNAAEKYSIPEIFTDHRAMLDAAELDFVDIVTRPDTHVGLVQDAVRAGAHIICQKPLAPNSDDVDELLSAVRTSELRFMVHENFRFQPWYREIKSLLESEVIGQRLHTLSFRNRAGDGWGDDAYLARQPYFQTMKQFLIFEAGIHTVDTFRYLGGEIESVWCTHRKLNPVIAGEDTALAVFRFESGASGLYDANRFNESTAENPRYTFGELLVEADGGTIRLHDDGRLTVQPLGRPQYEHAYAPSREGFAGDCVLATQQHFIDGLLHSREFETSAASYARSLAVQDAMYRSAASGRWEDTTP